MKKALAPKYSSLKIGQMLSTLEGNYRILGTSNVAGESRFQLISADKKKRFTVTSSQLAEKVVMSPFLHRVASYFKYVIAYNKDFDLYVKEAIRAQGLPVDDKMNWARWFEKNFENKLRKHQNLLDEDIIDEAVHHVIIQELFEPKKDGRTALQKFDPERLPDDVKSKPLAEQVTFFLKQIFSWRYSNAYEFTNEQNGYKKRKDEDAPSQQHIQLFQDGEDGEYNVLDKHTVEDKGFHHVEESDEISAVHDLFFNFLKTKYRENTAENIARIFNYVVESETGKKVQFLDEFKKDTGLSEASLKTLYTKFLKEMEEFVDEIGDEADGIDLIRVIRDAKKKKIHEILSPEGEKEPSKSVSKSRAIAPDPNIHVDPELTAASLKRRNSSYLNLPGKEAADSLPPNYQAIQPQPVPTQQQPLQPGEALPGSPQSSPSDVNQPKKPGQPGYQKDLAEDASNPQQNTNPNQPRRTIVPELPGVNHNASMEEASMSNKNANYKKSLRDKIAARAAERKTATKITKFAKLKHFAAEEPAEVQGALDELAGSLQELHDGVQALTENLDLVDVTKEENPAGHMAAKNKFARGFRRLAEENPEALADALNEIYHTLDDIAAGTENLASGLGIELTETPVEEAFTEEGQEELEGDIPAEEEDEAPVVEDEPFEEEELPKEASGSDGWFIQDIDKKKEAAVNKVLASLKNLSAKEIASLV